MADFRVKLLKKCVKEINEIDEQKLAQLALRIAQRPKNEDEPVFTPNQLSKLESSLGINSNQVSNLIEGISEIVNETAYHGLTSQQLASRLIACDVELSRAEALAAAWNEARSAVTESLKNNPVLPQVSYIAYKLAVEAGNDCRSGEALSTSAPRGILQLGLNNHSQSETLEMQFSHEQLTQFHSQLNRIQSQLDAIAEK